jgi:hypothetical protein
MALVPTGDVVQPLTSEDRSHGGAINTVRGAANPKCCSYVISCERLVGALRGGLLGRILIFGPGRLRKVLAEPASAEPDLRRML